MHSTEGLHPVNGQSLPEILLTEIEGEPRARDLDIAERLGFDRPRDIRKLIERNAEELTTFGVLARHGGASISGKGRVMPITEYWLNEEQALLIATVSDAPKAPAVRAMLIKTFVAWRRGHPANSEIDNTVTELSGSVRMAIGGIVKGIVHKEVTEAVTAVCEALLPKMVQATLASHNLMIRRGKTAGQVLRESGFPAVKGLAGWFGNRLVQLGYAIDGDGRSEQGDRTARMFDPDKVGVWLRAGGRVTVEQKIAERRGQTVIDFGAGTITPFRSR